MILFTAFKGINNTSFQLVSQIGGQSEFLTNSFRGVAKDVCGIEAQYDAVIMFGIDKNLKNKIRIEKCTRYNGELIYTDFDVVVLEDRLKEYGISYTVSDNPTRYLCNAAYYYMLKKNLNTVFVHIPSIGKMNEDFINTLVAFFKNYL